MILLEGTIQIPRAGQAALLPLLAEHIRLTRAEPGCLRFSVEPDPVQPEIYHVSEAFTDSAAFDAHQTRSRASAWGAASSHLTRNFRQREE